MFDKERNTPLNFKLRFYFTIVNAISLNIFKRYGDKVHTILPSWRHFISLEVI